MTEIESKVVEAWRQAAHNLGIRFTSPFTVTLQRDKRIECIGFVHHFGRRVGTIISVLKQPSSLADLVGKWQNEDYYISVLGSGYSNYDQKLFIDTLDDWQFFERILSGLRGIQENIGDKNEVPTVDLTNTPLAPWIQSVQADVSLSLFDVAQIAH